MAENFPNTTGPIDYLNQSPDYLNQKPSMPEAPKDPGASFSNWMKQSAELTAKQSFDKDISSPNTIEGVFEEFNKPVGPGSVGYASPDVDQYRFQEDFQSRGFNPDDPKNYQRWTDAETWGSALSKGLDSAMYRMGNSFVENWKGYGRMGSAIANWDLSKMLPDESEMLAQYYKDQKDSMKNFVFSPPDEVDDIFGKKTISDAIANTGYSLGTMAALGVELAADLAITFVTSGAGGASFGATFARLTGKKAAQEVAKVGAKEVGEQVAKTVAKEGAEAVAESAAKTAAKSGSTFSNFFSDLNKGWSTLGNQSADEIAKTARIVNNMEDAKKIAKLSKQTDDVLRQTFKEYYRIHSFNLENILKSKSFGDFAMNVGKGMPLFGTAFQYGEKIAKGAEIGLSAGKLTGIGLRGVQRLASEYNLASTEASMEAVSTYGDILDNMATGYQRDNNGDIPSGIEYNKMKENANRAAFSNYGTNMTILLTANKIQFGGLFNKFGPNQKWMKDLLQEQGGKILGVNRLFKGTKLLAKEYEKGFLGTYGLIPRIYKEFGKKQALYEIGNALRKDLLKFEISEGIQENLQEISAEGWKEYYSNRYKGIEENLTNAFGKGLDSQLTKRGFITFLQGALTGSITRFPSHLMSQGTEMLSNRVQASQYADQSQNPAVQMRKRMSEDMNMRNKMYEMLSNSKTEGKILNFNVQVESALQQQEAAAKGSEYEWHNARDNSLLNGVLNANQSGMSDTYIQAVRDMGDTMSTEDFESAFGVKLADTKYKTVKEFTESVSADLQKYSDTVDNIRKNVKNMADPLMFPPDSREQYIASILRNNQEEYIKIIALNQLKGVRAAERAQRLTSEINDIDEIASSSDYALRVLTNPKNFISELGNVAGELRSLKESLNNVDLSPELRGKIEKQIEAKTKELDLIKKWQGYWSDRTEVIKIKDKEGKEIDTEVPVERIFVGKKTKVKILDDKGNVTSETDGYDEKDPEVLETFRQILNLKNRQTGLSTTVSEKTINESFGKIVDLIRLDRDAMDYMEAYNGLYNPDVARQMIARLSDGDFKYRLLQFIDGIEGVIVDEIADYVGSILPAEGKVGAEAKPIGKQEIVRILQKHFNNQPLTPKELEILVQVKIMSIPIIDKITNSDAYKNLIMVSINENVGIVERKFAQEQVDKIFEIISEEIKTLTGTETKEDTIEAKKTEKEKAEPISDSEYKDFVDQDFITRDRLIAIAEKIEKNQQLSPREKAMYDSKGSQVESILRSRKEAETKVELTEDEKKELAEIDARLEVLVQEMMASGELMGNAESEALEKRKNEILKRVSTVDKKDEIVPAPVSTETVTKDTDASTVSNKEDFYASVSEDGTIHIRAKDGTIFKENIESMEKANKIVASLISDKKNVDFALDLFKDTSIDAKKLSSFVTRAKRSMLMYNKKANTEYTLLSDYNKTIDGRKLISMIKESILTDKPLDQIKKEERQKAKAAAEGKQTDLFDTTNLQENPTMTPEEIDSLVDELAEILGVSETESAAVSDIEVKKADIEKRRQEALNEKSKQGTLKNTPLEDITYYENKVKEAKERLDNITAKEGEFIPGSDRELGTFQALLVKAKEAVNRINAKYDAELATLESTTKTTAVSEKISTFGKTEPLTNDQLYDILRELTSCVKR